MGMHEEVLKEVLSKIKPKEHEYRYLSFISQLMSQYVSQCLDSIGVEDYEVTVQGSFAKDTFISGDVDLDIFFLLKPYKYSDRELEWLVARLSQCIEAKGIRVVLEYATHPYVTAYIGGIEVNIVPAFKVRDPSEIVSAVDRTPFHTQYVRKRLSEGMRDEVRLLKAFMKGVGVYGAEVKVQGFSGYLAELLVINYGSFMNVLRGSLEWKPFRTCIDIEGYYRSAKECLGKFPRSVLIVVDPVDPKRNAAAAVGLRAFSKFRICAKLFLQKPSTKFFERYEPYVKVSDLKRSILAACNSMHRKLVLIVSSTSHRSEDVVWGQVRRLERSLVNQLRSRELRILYVDSYFSSNESRAYTLVDIFHGESLVQLHEGPPAHVVENATKFVLKNVDSVVGPWIDFDNRLQCLKFRNVTHIVKECVKRIELEFVRPEAVIDLCQDPEFDKLLGNQKIVSWLYEAVNREYFKYLVS